MTTKTTQTAGESRAMSSSGHTPGPIMSRMGTKITPKSQPDKEGYLKAVFHFERGDSLREIHISDMRSEGGAPEIMRVLNGLPNFPQA